MQPELGQDHAKITQLSLERIDFLEGPFPGGFGGKSFDALHQHPAIPGTVENGDLSTFRQAPPETIQVVPGLVFAVGRADRVDDIAPRIQLFRDAFDGATFAGRIPAFEKDDYRPLLFVNLIAKLAQLNLSAGHFTNIGLAVEVQLRELGYQVYKQK